MPGKFQAHLGSRSRNILIYSIYLLAFVISLQNDIYVYRHSTSIDLLYRVVGSRLMEDGKSPYHDKWQAGQPTAARYYHPIPRYGQNINGVTVTPSILWLNTVFADMDFCRASYWWFGIQVAALFLCGLLLLISMGSFSQKLVALAGFILFFAFSRNFYLHLHSSQVYVLFALVFCAVYLLLKSKLHNKYFIIGIVLSVAVWLKPFFIFAFIPFLLQKNRSFLKGSMITAAILVLQVLAFDQVKYWKEYGSAMPQYANDIHIRNEPYYLQIVPPSFGVPSCIYPMKYPDKLPLKSNGLGSLQYYLDRLHLDVTAPWMFGAAAFSCCLLLALLARRSRSTEQLVALLFLMYLVAELFTPAMRLGYYLVEWAAAAIIILCNYKTNKLPAILMLAGLIINNGYVPFDSIHLGSIGETLMMTALAFFIFSRAGKKNYGLNHRIE
jgi:hypothetical protein